MTCSIGNRCDRYENKCRIGKAHGEVTLQRIRRFETRRVKRAEIITFSTMRHQNPENRNEKKKLPYSESCQVQGRRNSEAVKMCWRVGLSHNYGGSQKNMEQWRNDDWRQGKTDAQKISHRLNFSVSSVVSPVSTRKPLVVTNCKLMAKPIIA
jgi:hypothetical protein